MNRWIGLTGIVIVLGVTGCAANQERLGRHMNMVRTAQIYNPEATTENLDVIPAGVGERMEKSYEAYIGVDKEKEKSKSTTLIIGDF